MVRVSRPPSNPIASTAGLRTAIRPATGRLATTDSPLACLRRMRQAPIAQVFPEGTALQLAPGGVLHLQVHYTANGTAGTDRSKVGLIFAKEPPAEELRAGQFINAQFTIPPGAVDYEVATDLTFLQDATVRGLFPHTHVRGKRWSYTLELPDGTKRPLLSVPRYDFNWQTYYMFREPIAVPKGARIVSTAWYDNSTANKSNPDPAIAVKWGDQTWEEMQYTGILYSLKRGPRRRHPDQRAGFSRTEVRNNSHGAPCWIDNDPTGLLNVGDCRTAGRV